MAATPETIAALMSVVGLDEKNAKDTASKPEKAKEVLDFFTAHNIAADSKREHKVQLFIVFTKVKAAPHKDFVAKYVVGDKISTSAQVDAAVKTVNALKPDQLPTEAEFDKACGVGIVVTAEQIAEHVSAELKKSEPKALQASWAKNPGQTLGQLKRVEALRWANFTTVKDVLDAQVAAIIKDLPPLEAAAPKPKAKAAPAPAAAEAEVRNWGMVDVDAVAGGLARTWLRDINSVAPGETVYLCGWAHRVRHQSKMSFIVLRDGSGYIQVVLGGKVPVFHRETSVALRGKLVQEPKAATDVCPPLEVHVESWAIVGESDGDIENVITPESSVDKLFDQRHLVLRGQNASALLKVRCAMVHHFRQHFYKEHVHEVTPPTIVQTECEGGSSLFKLDYFEETAYMTQSSQLYLEPCLASIGDVYCLLPSYRAEKSKTKRHLTEFSHLEAEYGNIKFEDLLNRIEKMIVEVFAATIRDVGDLVAQLNPDQLVDKTADPKKPESWKFAPQYPFRRLKYADAIKLCNENGILNPDTQKPFEYGEDISDQPERAMVALIGTPVLMTHFPAVMKSFYMSRDATDRTLTESVDVLMPGIGEVVGGSMRIHDYAELMEACKRNNFDLNSYYWYTDQRKYGTVPHGGFGLGVERFLVWLCNAEHVRDACLFPRLMNRVTP